MKNIFKRATALLLSLLMVFSVCSTSLIIYATTPDERVTDKEINYVSLGDSMTNGYGLDGYNHNSGVADYGIGAYPNLFAGWLDAFNGEAIVNHAQLSMSGIRTEDIHWLLEFDYNDSKMIDLVDRAMEDWDSVAAEWNETFGCGDYWTVEEICDHSRTEAAFNHIAGLCTKCEDDKHLVEFPETVSEDGPYTRAEMSAVIAKYFQEQVAAADVISLSVGNGNLGVFGFGRILEVIGFSDTETYKNYNYVDVLRECDDVMKERLIGLINDLTPALEASGFTGELADVILYIVVSLALNYAGTLDAILQMNPDVEIILVPIMNTMGDMLGDVVDTLNQFIAGIPAYMQLTNHKVYKDATFYWAEAPEFVECWVNTYEYPLTNPIIRDRFVESIVGTSDEPGMIWEMLSDKVVPITLAEIEVYEKLEDAEKLAYAAGAYEIEEGVFVGSAELATSISMYLAFENAIVQAKDETVDLESIFSLGSILAGDPFGPVMEEFNAAAAEVAGDKLEVVCTFLAATVEAELEKTANELLAQNEISGTVKVTVTAEEIADYLASVEGAANVIAGNTVEALVEVVAKTYEATAAAGVCTAIENMLKLIQDDVNEKLATASQDKSISLNALGYMNCMISPSLDNVSERTLAWNFYMDATGDSKFTFLAGYVDDELKTALGDAYDSLGITGAGIVEQANPESSEELQKAIAAAGTLEDSAAATEEFIDSMLGGASAKEYIADKITSNEDLTADNAELLCTLLIMPDTLGTVVYESELASLLALFARCVIGNGIGAHPSQDGHAVLADSVIEAYFGFNTVGDKTDDILKDFEQYPLIKALISELTAKGYLNDNQILDIAFTVYDEYKDGSLEGDTLAIVQVVYEKIIVNEALSAEQRIDIIFTVCGALNDGTINSFVDIAKKLVAEDENGKQQVTELQAYAIVHCVYLAYINDGTIDANELRVIANLIYYIILGNPMMPMMRRGGTLDWVNFTWESLGEDADLSTFLAAVQQDSEAIGAKTAKEKVEIIQTVIEAIPADIKKSNPQVGAVTELAAKLTGADGNEQLLSDDQAAAILDSAFENFVEIKDEPISTEEAITNITKTVAEQIVGMEPEKFDKIMDAIQDTVGNSGVGGGDIVIPEIPKEVKLANELAHIFEEQGVIDAEQRGKLVEAVMPFLLGEPVSRSALVKQVYGIVYDEGFSVDKTIQIVIAVTTFAYENREGAFNYANPYYHKAMARVLTPERIELAQAYISVAKTKINEAIVALGGTPRAAIESDTTALKAALVEELLATYDTLVKIEEVLENDSLKNGDEYQIQATIDVLLTFEEDLNTHCANINAIATEAGILAMPYIAQAVGAINEYTQIAADIAVAAYEWCVENAQDFKADYIALTKLLSGYAAEIDPELGTAVYNFMINTPADALRTIHLYGDEAVDALIDRSGDYVDGVLGAAIKLARVIKKYGGKVYRAIRNDETCYGIYKELRYEVYPQIVELRAQAGMTGVAAGVYRELDRLTTYGIETAKEFYYAAIQAVKDEDFQAGIELKTAIDGLVSALATIDDEAIDYAEWLGTHAGAMAGAVLAGIYENWDEFYGVAAPIVYAKTVEIYNMVKDFVLNYDYDALIQQIIDAAIEIAPEVDAYLYDFFYNNPDKVDAFFEKYGDTIVALSEKYGVYALGVIGIAAAMFGEDMVDFILNNPEEVIEGIIIWAQKYGKRVVDILQVYAEYFGLCDAVRVEIAELGIELDKLRAQLEEAYKALQGKVGAEYEKAMEYIKQLMDMIAKIEDQIDVLTVKLQALIDAVNNLNDALKQLVADGLEAFGAVQKTLNNVAYAIYDLVNVLDQDFAGQIQDLIDKAKDYLNDAYESAIKGDYTIYKDSLYVAFGDNEDAAKAFVDVLNKYIADKGYNYEHNSIIYAEDGAKITDLLATIAADASVVANADLISIGYSYDQIAEDTLFVLLDLLFKGSTSISTEVNWNELVSSEIAVELNKTLAQIEAELVANENMSKTVAQLIPTLASLATSNITIAEAAMTALEYFAYNAVQYAVYMPQAIAMINQINPEAVIILNAISNPIAGAAISIPEVFEFSFGDYLDYIVDIINVESIAIAATNDAVVYAPTTEIVTTYTDIALGLDTLISYLADNYDELAINPKDATTTANYIATVMENALNIIVETFLLGDVDLDGDVDSDDLTLLARHVSGIEYIVNAVAINNANVNGDDAIDSDDLTKHARYVGGIITDWTQE